MKRILITTLLICLMLNVFSQTLEETKDYIETKFKELNLTTDSTTVFSNYNFFTYHIQNLLYFNRKFIVLSKYTQHSIYGGNSGMRQSTKYSEENYLVDISKLSSINFKKVNNKCVVTFFSKNTNSNFKFATEESDKPTSSIIGDFLDTELNLINKKFSNKIYPFEISFYTNTYDEEIIGKLKKAFKHLVGLNGGKIIDDLF